jgi:hypothetical protein
VNWLPVILAGVKAIADFVGFLRERQMLNEAALAAIAQAMQERSDEIAKASAARARVRSIIVDGGVPDVAGKWTRPD